MHRDDCFQPFAILDEFDRPFDAAEVLRERQQIRMRPRVTFALAQRVDLPAAPSPRQLVPANVVSSASDRFFDFRVFHVLTLTRHHDQWGAIDQ